MYKWEGITKTLSITIAKMSDTIAKASREIFTILKNLSSYERRNAVECASIFLLEYDNDTASVANDVEKEREILDIPNATEVAETCAGPITDDNSVHTEPTDARISCPYCLKQKKPAQARAHLKRCSKNPNIPTQRWICCKEETQKRKFYFDENEKSDFRRHLKGKSKVRVGCVKFWEGYRKNPDNITKKTRATEDIPDIPS